MDLLLLDKDLNEIIQKIARYKCSLNAQAGHEANASQNCGQHNYARALEEKHPSLNNFPKNLAKYKKEDEFMENF